MKISFNKTTSYALLVLAGALTVVAIIFLYRNTQDLFKKSLQDRVIAIASTAAIQFDPIILDDITNDESIGTPTYVETVKRLQKIRANNPNLKFIYIQRSTVRPEILEFVADADSMNPDIPTDLNNDGVIDESDALNRPGEEYDVSDYPDFVSIAFSENYVDDELSIDQWGMHLSATSPIDGAGQNNYLIGVDVDVSDFVTLTNLALIPFIAVAGFELLLLMALTVVLVRMWGGRVTLLQELDRQKDELLSIVSHQLAAPVTAIKWYLESILDDGKNLKDEQKTDMKSMQSITEDLSDLVSMILDVSRIQLGKMRVDPQALDLQLFFSEILGVIEPKAKEKPVNLIKSLPDKLPVALLDKRLTRMTVENLLTNAVKYTPKDGNVWFTVTIDAKNLLSITVKDTGVGIPKADQGKIFGKQFRASNVRNAIDGNGFGLYVAKGAIEGQDGKIWFESEEGKGTTFFVQVPLKLAPPEAKS